MSHTDYNSISKKNATEETKVNPDPEVTTPDPEVTPAPVQQPEPEASAQPKYILGIVVDCKRLNVRKEASLTAAIVCIIAVDSDVVVNLDESPDEWYKVHVDDKEGFCMKKFIELAQ